MTAPMHTRCPQCQTIFHVTPAQLEARAGLVRCGICASAFQADQNLIETLPNNHRAAHTPAADEIARTDPIERTVTGPPNSPADDDLPLMNEFPLVPERRRTPTAVWLLGGVLLLALLAAQVAYFYAPQLARDARLKPWLALYCERAGCDLKPSRANVADRTGTNQRGAASALRKRAAPQRCARQPRRAGPTPPGHGGQPDRQRGSGAGAPRLHAGTVPGIPRRPWRAGAERCRACAPRRHQRRWPRRRLRDTSRHLTGITDVNIFPCVPEIIL